MTAVEWLYDQLEFDDSISMETIHNVFEQAKEMEKNQSHMYAEFAIKCEYMTGKVLNFDEFIKIRNQ
jgi:hypothetical protein